MPNAIRAKCKEDHKNRETEREGERAKTHLFESEKSKSSKYKEDLIYLGLKVHKEKLRMKPEPYPPKTDSRSKHAKGPAHV